MFFIFISLLNRSKVKRKSVSLISVVRFFVFIRKTPHHKDSLAFFFVFLFVNFFRCCEKTDSETELFWYTRKTGRGELCSPAKIWWNHLRVTESSTPTVRKSNSFCAEFTLFCVRFFATLRMTNSYKHPTKNPRKSRISAESLQWTEKARILYMRITYLFLKTSKIFL